MKFGDHIVLADIGTDWPEVFGPFVNLSEAETVQEALDADRRVFSTEIQSLVADTVDGYLYELDEILDA